MTPEEYKETMKTLAGDENLLPGIYNFCDQWCEKCTWPDQEEPILNFLAILDEVRKKANYSFPNAGKFDYFQCFASIQ
ncbi:MAG: hypothetical protein D4R64_00130 [Porphyromonadaceae bacterium]|nr:MAG: hypothetical protein D4R64_00130 [Porphyromonadaceae bacterium]